MKLKRIAALCQKSKRYILCNIIDSAGTITQWLGDNNAAYPLHGLPQLDRDSLCKMFDISEKQKDNVYIGLEEMPKGINTKDTDPAERPVEEERLGFIHYGKELILLKTQEGIVFIQEKYLSPLEDELDALVFYERKKETGQVYIAVKAGLMLRAVIMPCEVVNLPFIDQLEKILRECKRVLENPHPHPHLKEEEAGGFQLSWTEEPPQGGEKP